MRIVAPSPALAPHVREFMLVEVCEETTRVRLPEPGLVLGVRYSGAASLLERASAAPLPDVTLTGISNVARRMRTSAGGGVLLARFHPGGAARFFAEPLHELFGASLALEQLLGRREAEQLQARVSEATSDGARVAALEVFLRARLRPEPADPIVAAAVRAIVAAPAQIQIRALARRLGVSQDPLEKRFRRVVGASPKQLASLLRLRAAIDRYRPGASLTNLAVDAGYFDQSHFSRELRAVTGEAPGRFLRASAQGASR